MTTLELTDRYGGNPPSWLRGCRGDCEAMGYVPIKGPFAEPEYVVAWEAAHVQPHDGECDGWHFISCLDCHGTGRVSWLASVARIPRWLWEGAPVIRPSNQGQPERVSER